MQCLYRSKLKPYDIYKQHQTTSFHVAAEPCHASWSGWSGTDSAFSSGTSGCSSSKKEDLIIWLESRMNMGQVGSPMWWHTETAIPHNVGNPWKSEYNDNLVWAILLKVLSVWKSTVIPQTGGSALQFGLLLLYHSICWLREMALCLAGCYTTCKRLISGSNSVTFLPNAGPMYLSQLQFGLLFVQLIGRCICRLMRKMAICLAGWIRLSLTLSLFGQLSSLHITNFSVSGYFLSLQTSIFTTGTGTLDFWNLLWKNKNMYTVYMYNVLLTFTVAWLKGKKNPFAGLWSGQLG